MMLDLTSVRLFVLAVEFSSLTRAAEAAGTVQPVVSHRLKQLEAQLGRRLLDRTPRSLRPTPAGEAFLPLARTLLAAHEAARAPPGVAAVRFAIGLSDHATGAGLPSLLARLRSALPAETRLAVQLGHSLAMRTRFDTGELDAIVVRREGGGTEGECLGTDPLGWRGEAGAGQEIALATLGPPCGVREVAIRALEAARRPWREAFVAGSCTALLAGVRAGLGVAPMGRVASGGLADAGPALGLPPLGQSEIVLFARGGGAVLGAAVRALAAGVRAGL